MQEFLTNNTVSCNLMSLTGYRTLVIFNALLESPKTLEEINECLLNNQYINERFSPDTLRIYLNSLRKVGCDITRANKSNNNKYILCSHPFEYEIPKSQLKALAKMYKSLQEQLDVRDIINLENLFRTLIKYIKNKSNVEFLENISLLKRVDRDMINDLLLHCKNKNQITFLYNSPRSGEKKIELIADKITIKADKLYLWGSNLTHKEYSFFLLDRIIKICDIKLIKSKEVFPITKLVYEIYKTKENISLEVDEKIIQEFEEKVIIEKEMQNEFSAMQRILSLAGNCKVLEPDFFIENLINKLKNMEKIYEKS